MTAVFTLSVWSSVGELSLMIGVPVAAMLANAPNSTDWSVNGQPLDVPQRVDAVGGRATVVVHRHRAVGVRRDDVAGTDIGEHRHVDGRSDGDGVTIERKMLMSPGLIVPGQQPQIAAPWSCPGT